ncbi:hypothetical protein DM01DRAFT_1228004 [Hesseltinella vesiculosa]|uniref:PH domain-containing protein n=1 Tax=Hesseltinella vesiculosa TaxID=101127 RepID=A0A1X2GPA6_9FUNG|nr:hypothetical protein DM01DRAFT_1228004 [Hesseltinella vesiculosa]
MFLLYTEPAKSMSSRSSLANSSKWFPKIRKGINASNTTMVGYSKVMSATSDTPMIASGQRLYQLAHPKHEAVGLPSFEILVDFQWQRPLPTPKQLQPPAAASLCPPRSYPWLKYPMDTISPISPDFEQPETLFADKDAIDAAIHVASNGDFLTFYVHGLAYPEWKRYWVTLDEHHLILRPFAYKNKDPLYTIPLQQLVQVSKPTEEDQEYICLNRQLSAVLQFELPTMTSQLRENTSCAAWSGPGGSKIYMQADNAISALLWRRALTFHILTLERQNDQILGPAANDKQENIYDINYSRFLW